MSEGVTACVRSVSESNKVWHGSSAGGRGVNVCNCVCKNCEFNKVWHGSSLEERVTVCVK